MTTRVPELFGSMVFNDEVMKERLPKDIYKALHKTMDEGLHLQLIFRSFVAVHNCFPLLYMFYCRSYC